MYFNNPITIQETLLPKFLSTFISGGPTFDTQVIRTFRGREARLARHRRPINKYVIDNCLLTHAQINLLLQFFCARQGKHNAFLFMDVADHMAENQQVIPSQQDDKSFYLAKQYSDIQQKESQATYRIILTPIKETIRVLYEEKQLPEESFKFDTEKKLLVFKKELNPALIRTYFSFYIPVRFNNDQIEYESRIDNMVKVKNCSLLEILL
ncbi:DUF2460 domain-containing protein [Candidatus Sneabacter namystus]|uniref:DUF2460 domain-containing protein n=1 Tax=Candidatus Sneabacter namystus TaxID=2601646 RepID=A0A5C0UJ17_9RICK|nr:DUF2460 domain-containing protein [Candidatus Sneabacter namystus]QEK39750.1 hypothetical protein FZC37_02315 [Candidatus Sneabacter namystus]